MGCRVGWFFTLASITTAGCSLLTAVDGLTSGGGADTGAPIEIPDAPADVPADAGADADACSDCVRPAGVVARGGQSADGLFVHDKHVYWVERVSNGSVLRCPVEGCEAPEVLAASQAVPFAVAVFQNTVVWTTNEDGEVKKLEPDGGVVSVDSDLVGPSDIALSAGVYFVPGVVSGGRSALYRCGLTGCGANYFYLYESQMAEQLTATPIGLVWLIGGTRLRHCPDAGCSAAANARTLYTEPNRIDAFAVDADFVYWAAGGVAGGIHSVPVAGLPDAGTSTVVVPDVTNVSALVVDANELFYASRKTGSVFRVARVGGSAPTLLWSSPGALPRSLVVRDGYVYWVDGADGTIRRTAR